MAAKKKVLKKSVSKASKKSASKKRPVDVLIDDTMLMEEEMVVSSNKSSSGRRYITKRNIVILLLLASFGYLVYLNRGLFVAAIVNNQPITRLAVLSELERRQGSSALDSIITETIIMQEAQKKNVIVSQEDIDAEINTISENLKGQGQDLDQLLQLQGMKKEDLVKQIRIQKMVEKILGDKVTASDEDVKKYLDENKSSFPADMKIEEKETQARTQIKQQKLGTEFQTWLTEVKAQSNIRYFVSY